jgi:hypothetical protein
MESHVVCLGDAEDNTKHKNRAAPEGPYQAEPRPYRRLLIASCCLLFLIAVAIPVSVILLKDDNSNDPSRGVSGADGSNASPSESITSSPVASPGAAPTATGPEETATDVPLATPTLAPSLAPVTSAPTAALVNLPTLLATVTPTAILEDPSTFQNQALNWMLNNDLLPYDNVPQVEILERYAVVVMDFALHDGESRVANNYAFIPACDWPGVTCMDVVDSNISRITQINWARMNLNGVLPTEVAVLEDLVTLDLAENDIEGTLPEGLFTLKDLRFLYLHDNAFTGTLSENFSELSALESLYLGDNEFSGPFPKGLGSPSLGGGDANVRPLRYLSLYRNSITGSIPVNMNLRRLYLLDLGYNDMTGTLPADWSNGVNTMNALTLLYLNHNSFRGTIPSTYPELGNDRLQVYELNDNQLTGEVPGGYVVRNLLQSVEMQNNNFSSINNDVCSLIVFIGGEITNFKADCEVCTCNSLCGNDRCI